MTTSCVGGLRNPRPSLRKSFATTSASRPINSGAIVPEKQRIQYRVDDETITEGVLIFAITSHAVGGHRNAESNRGNSRPC